jgi:hypothetical protein
VDAVAADPLDDGNTLYALHFYAATHGEELRRKAEKALSAGTPVFVSECSICDACGDGAIDYDSGEAWRGLIERHGLSYIAWSLSNRDESAALIRSDCFETITVMIQREVARRICAAPNTPDYGAFSLFVQWYTRPELLFDVPPHCFHPQPKVTSSVIRLTRRREKPFAVSDEQLLFQIIRAAFNQRRKTLANALASGLGCERALIEQALENCGFDIRIRGEALDLGSFVALTDELAKRL